MTNLGFHGGAKFGAVCLQHGDVVFNGHGVIHLTAKTLSGNAHPNTFARCINSSRSASRTTAHNQHIKVFFGVDLGSIAMSCTCVDLGHNFFHRHAARAKYFAIQEHHGHCHDFALGHFLLERTAFNDHRFHFGIEDGHERQSLHHIRTVVARQGHVDLEVEVAIECFDGIDDIGFYFGRVTPGPKQSQYQGCELVTQGQSCKAHTLRLTLADH